TFFFSSRRRHTRSKRDWSSDVCSSDLKAKGVTKDWNFICVESSIFKAKRFVKGGSGCCVELELLEFQQRAHHGHHDHHDHHDHRSEERRVGKEWRSRRTRYRGKEK